MEPRDMLAAALPPQIAGWGPFEMPASCYRDATFRLLHLEDVSRSWIRSGRRLVTRNCYRFMSAAERAWIPAWWPSDG